MSKDEHWMDEKKPDTAFNRRVAGVRSTQVRMQAAAVPMLKIRAGGAASLISTPGGTGDAPLPPAAGPTPSSPKALAMVPEQPEKYQAMMRKAQALASPGGQPKAGAEQKKQ